MPRHGRCSHNVCRLCVQGEKSLQPPCVHCKDHHDFKSYDENKQMRCLLLCYKSMCEQIRASLLYPQVAGRNINKGEATPTSNQCLSGQMSVQDMVNEGVAYEDILSAISVDVPKIDIDTDTNTSPTADYLTAKPFVADTSAHIFTPNNMEVNQCAPITVSSPTFSNVSTSQSSVFEAITTAEVKRERLTPPSTTPSQQSVQLTPQIIKQQSVNGHITTLPVSSSVGSHLCTVIHTQALTAPLQTITTPAINNHPTTLVHLNQLGQLKSSGTTNITYLSTNARGIVVPIVSSSGTTTAPLTIASARLQTLNRQLARARALSLAATTTTTAAANVAAIKPLTNAVGKRSMINTSVTYATDTKSLAQTAFKMSISPSPVLRSLTITSSNKSIEAATDNIILSTAATRTSTGVTSASTSTTNKQSPATPSSVQTIRQTPPPIKTVSHGSAMYSVLYTGIGNKITIKRKTDGDNSSNQKVFDVICYH